VTKKIVLCDQCDIFKYHAELEDFFISVLGIDYLNLVILTDESSIRDFTFSYNGDAHVKKCDTLEEEYNNWDSWFLMKMNEVYGDKLFVNMNDTLIVLMEKIRLMQSSLIN
jgi:hypothetical protein